MKSHSINTPAFILSILILNLLQNTFHSNKQDENVIDASSDRIFMVHSKNTIITPQIDHPSQIQDSIRSEYAYSNPEMMILNVYRGQKPLSNTQTNDENYRKSKNFTKVDNILSIVPLPQTGKLSNILMKIDHFTQEYNQTNERMLFFMNILSILMAICLPMASMSARMIKSLKMKILHQMAIVDVIFDYFMDECELVDDERVC